MNKKFLKRVAAFAMAATLVLGNAAIAFAADGTATGEGANEGAKPEYPVASITLPVVTNEKMYDYIIDPNELIKGTKDNAASEQHYDWSTDFNASGTLWFQQFASPAVAGLKKFEPTSDSLKIENKSAVDITVKAKVVADASYTGGITFVTGSTFATAGKNIYIATKGTKKDVTDQGAAGTEAPVAAVAVKGLGAANGAELSFDLKGNVNNFRLAYDSIGNKYEYKMSTASALVWSEGSFQLEGACNTANADKVWTDKDNGPKLDVTWSWEAKSSGGVTTYALTKVAATGNLVYEFDDASAPTGSLTAVTVNGTARNGAITAGNIAYNASTKKFVIQKASVTNFGITEGNTTVVATIGGTEYTFTY